MLWGIVSLVIVGLSSIIVGIVMGCAPKKNLDPGIIIMAGAVVNAAGGGLMMLNIDLSDIDGSVIFWCGLSCMMAGAFNCVMQIIMAHAMQKGPNGIIWTVIQSAMIFPFLTGIIFFNVEPRSIRLFGMFLILISLVLSGLSKDNHCSGSGWKLQTLAAFLLAGIIQNLSSLPSYFESAQQISPVFRTTCLSIGGVAITLPRTWCLRNKISFKENFKSKWLWLFVILLQFVNLLFPVIFHYPAMDILANCGMGSLSYPLLGSSCLVGFSLYSIFILREKNSLLQYAALLSCLAGIIMICL